MASKAGTAEVFLTCNAKQPERVIAKLTEAAKQMAAEVMRAQTRLDELNKAGLGNSKEATSLQRTIKKDTELIEIFSTATSHVIEKQKTLGDVLNNLSTTKLADLRRALIQAKSEFAQLSEASGAMKLRDAKNNITEIQRQIDKLSGSVNKQSSAFKNMLQNITAYIGVFQTISIAQQKFEQFMRSTLKYSDQLADIRKVSGLTMRDINGLSKELSKLDTRTTQEGLASIAYSGAKLGMGKYGTAGLQGFVEAANQVNVALKEDLGDEALTSLSKIVEVMGLIPKLGVEKSMLATGSAIFKLASTSTATSENIVEFTKRLTGIARTAGITTDQLLALGSASDSMMLMPEVASTAFNKLITSLQRNPDAIEKSLGIPKGMINDYFKQGQAMEAIVTIFQKMKEKGNMSALNDVFKDLGSDGARLIGVMVTMAKNVDMLQEHLNTSRTEFQKSSAITQEYNIQQETAAAYMERANNVWEKAFVNPDGIDNVKELAKEWYNLSNTLTQSTTWMNAMKSIIYGVVGAIKTFIITLPGLIIGMGAAGVAGAAYTAIKAIKEFGSVLSALEYGILVVRDALKGLSLAARLTWIGAAIGAVSALVMYFAELNAKAKEVKDVMGDLDKTFKKTQTSIYAQEEEVRRYIRAINDLKEGTKDRNSAINQFNEIYGQYMSKLLSEKATAEDIARAYQEVCNQLRQKNMLEAKQDWSKKNITPRYEAAGNILGNYGDQVKGTQYSQYGTTRLRDLTNSNQSVGQILKTIGNWFGVKGGTATQIWRNPNGQISVADQVTGYGYMREQTQNEKLYAQAVRYIRQQRYADTLARKADELFGTDKLTEIPKENPGELNPPTPKTSGGKPAANAAKNSGKAEANALLANINSYYETQKTKYLQWVEDMNKNGEQVSEGEVKSVLDRFDVNLDKVRGEARKAIATGSTEVYDGLKKDLNKDLFGAMTATDTSLLNQIDKADVTKLHDLFAKLSGDLSKENHRSLSENLGALLDEIFHKGTSDLLDAQKRLVQRQRELQKMLADMDYTGTVQRNTRSNLDQNGLLPAAANVDRFSEAGVKTMATAFEALTKKIRESWTSLYDFDMETEEGRKAFVAYLSDPAIAQGFDFQKMSIMDLQALWLELIKYPDRYTAAQKQQDDERSKVVEKKWTNNASQQKSQQDINDLTTISKSYTAMRQGSETLGNFEMDDPEVELLTAKIQLMRDKLAFMKENHDAEEKIIEQDKAIQDEENSLTEMLVSNIKARMEAIQTMIDPIATFGTEVGDAFAQMQYNAEEGREAFENAMQSMIKSLMELTVKMSVEYANQAAMKKALNKETLSLTKKGEKENKKETEKGEKGITDVIDTQGAVQQSLVQTVSFGITKIKKTASQQSAAQQQADAATEVAATQNQTLADVVLGIAGGSAKIIAKLGWWGIPLIAVITALLNGLMSYATSTVAGLFGGSSSSTTSNTASTNTKLVSGMLTYDKGNLQQLYIGNDGRIYSAEEQSEELGTGIVDHPIATTVNGAPALVGEQGPELVVGRETTAAMMQNAPQLLQTLLQFDKNKSLQGMGGMGLFDAGNVQEALSDADLDANPNGGSNAQLLTVLTQMTTLLTSLNTNGVKSNISMYGRNGMYANMQKATQFMKGK